jgi:hypothetical protein
VIAGAALVAGPHFDGQRSFLGGGTVQLGGSLCEHRRADRYGTGKAKAMADFFMGVLL